MSGTPRQIAVCVVAVGVLLVVAAGFATSAGTSHSYGSIRATPSTSGARSTHVVTEVLGNETDGTNWDGFEISYSYTSADVRGVTESDIEAIGIDRGNDDPGAQVDVDVTGDVTNVSHSDDGTTLNITLTGRHVLHRGDQLVVAYHGVKNPTGPGTYDVSLTANPPSDTRTVFALLNITAADGGGTTTGATPGFGPAVGLLAVLGATLLAHRHRK